MKARSILMSRMLWSLSLAGGAFLACSSTPPHVRVETSLPLAGEGPRAALQASVETPASEEAPAETESPYDVLEEIQSEYGAVVERLAAGDAVEDEVFGRLTDRLRESALACADMADCEVSRFVDVMSELLREQSLALLGQAEGIEASRQIDEPIEEEDIPQDPGASSVVSAMPDLGDTVALLRGTDLREIIHLNGRVNAALDDWLTWMRPMLMESYENYQYLRQRIAPIYEEAGLPEALLFAMIATETRGKVHSYSHAGAAGLLQFMRHTGSRYGLRTVDGFDLRLDPEAATRANVKYLNDQFEALNDDLEKALAAYNGGEYRMRRLHRRYRNASFWDERIFYRLPRETREYVPRILAAAWLFLHPEDYNLEFPVLENQLTELVVERDISLGELTICLGQVGSANGWFRTLRNLNPRLTPGERVKAGEILTIPQQLVSHYEERCLNGDIVQIAAELHDANYPFGDMEVYVVRRGDTLGRIASRFRCATTGELAELNHIRPPRYLIRVGQELRIPDCP